MGQEDLRVSKKYMTIYGIGLGGVKRLGGEGYG